MKNLIAIVLGAVIWLSGYQSALAQGNSNATNAYFVDCNKNGSINQALASGHRNIAFTGTCVGDISTEGFNQLEISGADEERENNVIVGDINITGPTSLKLANFEVIESDGVRLTLGVAGTATDIVVAGVLEVRFGSNMILNGIDVNGSVIINHNSWGLLRSSDSRTSTIVGRFDDRALQIVNQSSAVIQAGTTIENTSSEDALIVANGSRGLMNGGTISGGASVIRMSSFEVRGGTIESAGASPTAISVASHSLLTLRPNGIYVGNVHVSGDSALMNERSGAVVISGDLSCGDEESSLSGLITASAISPGCTSFQDL